MKRIQFFLIVMMLSFGIAMAGTEFYEGNFLYETLTDSTVQVNKVNATFPGGACDIPATVTYSGITYNVVRVRAYFITNFNIAKHPTSITVPEGVTTITAGQDGTFDGSLSHDADSLVSITLPSTLTNTSFPAFTFRITNTTNKFRTFTIKMATPPTVVANTFYNIDLTKLTIYIPNGKKQAYSDAGWNTTTWPGVKIVENAPPGATVPSSPTITTVTSGYAQAIVAFSAPASDGGATITSYTVTANPGGITKTAPSSPIYVTGLSNGTPYTFTVIATNAVGNSTPSTASVAVVPVSQYVLPSATTQLLSICQSTKTDLHMINSVDSMDYSADLRQITIFKKGGVSYTYDIATVDSVGVITGSAWSDSLKVALDVTRYSVVGDSVTNNRTNLLKAVTAARNASANLYFPNGIYLCQGSLEAQNIRFIGQNRTNTILKDLVRRGHTIEGAENMTFENYFITDGNSLSRIYRNCKFVVNIPYSSEIVFYSGMYVMGADNEFTDCDFVFPKFWIGLYIRKYNSVLVKNCTFNLSGTGSATHNIRLEEPNIVDAKVSIIGNTIIGGTTGIFLAPSRNIPMKGGLIEGNKLYNQDEESIAMDGYGNDASMIPVICNGPIASTSNDANGNLVISMDSMYYDQKKPSPVSLRTDWNNFYFSFDTGSGMEGTLVKIKGFDSIANTLTLDTVLVASSVTVGGDGGVQSGFFNWTVRGNSVTGTLGASNIHGTAISIYLNVFGMLVENNTVTNCARGLNLAGGDMLTYYRTLAYNNVVRNNTFTDCDRYGEGAPNEDKCAIGFPSYWGGTGSLQFNNQFINNTVNGGRVFFERQRNFVEIGNTYNNVTRLAVDVQ